MQTVLSTTYPIDIAAAAERLKHVVRKTPLQYNPHLSLRYDCNIYLKREDLQVVRSYKLRGAYNLISSLPEDQLQKGVVCASAGNHAQGFAYSCKQLDIKGVVFMPVITPRQKVNQTRMFGGDNIDIKLVGDTFDDCARECSVSRVYGGIHFRHACEEGLVLGSNVAKEVLKKFGGI